MRRLLIVLTLLATGVAQPGPVHAGAVVCGADVDAGHFAIRKVYDPSGRAVSFHGTYTTPPELRVSTPENYHLFGGFWLLRTSDFLQESHAFFDYGSYFDPPGVRLSYQGTELVSQTVPSSNYPPDGPDGSFGFTNNLNPGTYYFIIFADGDGSTHWDVTFSDVGGATCESVNGVTGQVVHYTPLDFTGGTQVVAPGYGYAQDAKLSFTNPWPGMIGALFCYEPPPFPVPKLHWTIDGHTSDYRCGNGNDEFSFDSINVPWHNFAGTLSYEGKVDTILFEFLEMSLTPG